eukprot:NODE_2_length_91304_cov_0.692462.p6 type:complete len:822 gc:universal NODE_2_length_91304_cov_0.692462:64742-62277(-)
MSLSELLQQTLNPATQQAATASLMSSVENQPATLLSLVDLSTNPDKIISHTASVFLKNAIIRHYHQNDYMDLESRNMLKQKLLHLLTAQNCSKIVKQQISVCISTIADSDNWSELPKILGEYLSQSNLETQMLLLETIYTYVSLWKSYDLTHGIVSDIKGSVNSFFVPLLLPYMDSLFSNYPNEMPIEQRDLQLELFINISKIFLCFIFHDIPEEILGFLPRFCEIWCYFLLWKDANYKNHEQSLINESTKLTKLRGSILDIIQTLISKYMDDIDKYLDGIIQSVWDLVLEYSFTVEESLNNSIMITSTRDVMMSKALQVVTLCIKLNKGIHIFVGNGNTEEIDFMVNKVIVGNVLVRREDIELFEDEPLTYAQREIEGSDSISITKSTSELVKVLVESSPISSSITQSCLRFVKEFLKLYNQNDPNSWKYKSTATRLICSVCIDPAAYAEVLSSFLTENIMPDLAATTTPILLADAIYFITHFRGLFQKDQLFNVMENLTNILKIQSENPNTVVCTFISNAYERILSVKQNGIMLFESKDIQTLIEPIFTAFFTILNKKEGVYLSENDYYLKVMVRLIMVLKQDVSPYNNVLLTTFFNFLERVGKNPVNPKFNHYLFEAIGMVLRFSCNNNPQVVQQFDEQLIPIFLSILNMEIIEFSPYIFQILTVLLDAHPGNQLPLNLKELLSFLVKPDVWKANSNVQSLVRLFQAYMINSPNIFQDRNLVLPLLGVFQNLLNSRVNESFALKLLTALFHYTPFESFRDHSKQIFSILLGKLQTNKQTRFAVEFTLFVSYLLANNAFGPDYVVKTMESIQPGYFILI